MQTHREQHTFSRCWCRNQTDPHTLSTFKQSEFIYSSSISTYLANEADSDFDHEEYNNAAAEDEEPAFYEH